VPASVAAYGRTVLVADGKILKAAGRLRHRDPSTTLRNYADALPLDGEDVADAP
jgi:hypothetical protein